MNKGLLRVIFAVALVVCVGSAGYLGYRASHNAKQQQQEEELAKEVLSTEVKVDINDLLNLNFTGEREGITSEIPEDVFTEDSDKKIDFEKLQSYNDELIAWIYVEGTQIDYPIARHEGKKAGEDQDYYLNYDMYREPSYSGCIFIEDENAADFQDPNTIVYGHNMKNGTMFKGLHKFEEESFFNENQYIYIYLPDRTLVYEIFAAYTTDDNRILTMYDFSKKDVYQQYINNVTNAHYMGAFVREGVSVTTDDKMITLSTCVGGQPENRYLVQGVLKYDKAIQ